MEDLTADGKVTKRIIKEGTGDFPKQRDNVSGTIYTLENCGRLILPSV